MFLLTVKLMLLRNFLKLSVKRVLCKQECSNKGDTVNQSYRMKEKAASCIHRLRILNNFNSSIAAKQSTPRQEKFNREVTWKMYFSK